MHMWVSLREIVCAHVGVIKRDCVCTCGCGSAHVLVWLRDFVCMCVCVCVCGGGSGWVWLRECLCVCGCVHVWCG